MKIAYRSIVLSLMTLLFNCVPIYAQEQQPNDERIIFIDAKVSSIKAFEKENQNKLKTFEAIETESGMKFTELPDVPGSVPEDSLFMAYILKNTDGKALMHEIDPTSQSGDWSASFTHYFDDQERTIMFEFYSGSFNSRCTDILKIRKKYYFDENFSLIKDVVTYTDKDEKLIKNIERCDTYGIQRKEPRIYGTYKEVVTQTKNGRTPYIKEIPAEKSENTHESYTPSPARQYYEQQRLQLERENEKIDKENAETYRINQRRAKLRFILYVTSAASILIAIILMIRKKVKSKNVEKN